MERPLWQILLTLLLLGFLVRRGAVGVMLYLDGAAPAGLVGAYVAQVAIGLVAAAGLWLGRRWVLAALLVLGVAIGGTALLESLLGLRPILAAVAELLVVALGIGALFLILRHELGGGPRDAREPGVPREARQATRARSADPTH